MTHILLSIVCRVAHDKTTSSSTPPPPPLPHEIPAVVRRAGRIYYVRAHKMMIVAAAPFGVVCSSIHTGEYEIAEEKERKSRGRIQKKKKKKKKYSHPSSSMTHFTFECVLYSVDYGSCIDQYVSCRISHGLLLFTLCALSSIAKLTLSSVLVARLQLPHSFRHWLEVSSPHGWQPNETRPATHTSCTRLQITEKQKKQGEKKNKYKIRLMVWRCKCLEYGYSYVVIWNKPDRMPAVQQSLLAVSSVVCMSGYMCWK